MPQSKKAIQVPVNVKLEIANQHKVLSNLAGDMQETMSGFDPASALYKNAVKSFSKIASKLNFSEALLGKDFFSEADLSRVVKEMGMVSDIMTEINFKIQNTKSFKTLGIDTTELDNARESLAALRKEISKQSNKSVGSLMGTGKGQVSSSFLGELQGLSSKSGFKADKSYAANITTMTSKLEQQKATYQSLQNEIDKATQEAEEYLNVTGRLANDISGVKLKGTNADIAAAMSKMIRSHTVGEDGNWVAGGKAYAQATSRWLGLGQIDFSKSAQEIADAIEQAINAALSEKGGRTGNALVQNSRKYSTGTDAEKQAIEDLIQEDSSLALKQIEELKKNATAHDQLTSSIEAQIATLKQLREAYEGEIKRLNQDPLDKAQQRVDNAIVAANKQLEEQHNNAKNANKTVGGVQESSYKAQDAYTEQQRLEGLQKEAADRRAQEAESFKENLKQSVRHWMSAQQIINIIKDGIRQAVQDIKGLDSAMSNIAVVTDMSISDLWGKINDYMAIAQQYGVTTQGVYEVSQLYYQQGLATAEVMELTTETLKLARVANMDYKDSADAMTVALRGFKMEMSEAATVTDVYSKVAAVTASDQAELAIAMSKTASSAASVGSSFENTTAMLAVMVETTRESAQNLGSALKSIISRYGEMKSGLTQDSEGEIIDYNKVDTALRSVGISIKDAQGQFRDFDDVIFELSEAWGGLDKNTQRYIATIMAGNRQQSRFIALVDNYERLKEVQAAADNSEDAGLLQYAKTLDSLETKMNNIKTSFQQFYMSIFNGEDFKNILDIINNVIKSLNRVGPLLGSLNILNLINQIKMVGQLLINSFSNGLSKIQKSRQEWQDAFTGGWESAGDKIGQKIANGISGRLNEAVAGVKASIESLGITTAPAGANINNRANFALQSLNDLDDDAKIELGSSVIGQYLNIADQIKNNPNASQADKEFEAAIRRAADEFEHGTAKAALEIIDAAEQARNIEIDGAHKEEKIEQQKTTKETPSAWQEFTDGMLKNKKLQTAGKWAYGIGTAAQTAGMMINQDTMGGYDASTIAQGIGGAASAFGQFVTGNFVGAAISAFTTIATTWTRISEREKVKLENLEKASEKANIERAEKNNRAQELSETLSNLKKLQAARNESQEAEQAFIEASNAAAEKFPELVSYYDKTGNAIVDTVKNAAEQEWLLIDARRQAAKATSDAAAAELKAAQEDEEQKEKDYKSYNNFGVEDNNWDAKELALALEGKETWAEYSQRQRELDARNLSAWKLNGKEVYNEDAYYSALIDENSIFLQTLRNSAGQNDSEVINNLLQAAYDLETEEDKNNTINAITEYLRGKHLITDAETVYDYLEEISGAESAWKASQIRSEAGRKAVLNSGIEDYFTLYDPRIGQEQGYEWRQLENFENYFYDMALSGLNYDESDFEDGKLKDTQQTEFTTKLNDLSQAFNEWYLNGISELQQQNFNDIMSNPTSYSSKELQNELDKLGIGEGLLNDEIMSLWASETVSEYERLIAAFEIKGVSSREEDNLDKIRDYEDQLNAQHGEDRGISLLIANDLQAAQQYLEFQQDCQDIINSGNVGAGNAAQARMDRVLTELVNINTNADKIFGIDRVQFDANELTELETLLTASNAGTYEWGYGLINFIKEATGIKLAFDDIESILYENLNTQLNTIYDSIDNFISEIGNVSSKNESGFSLEEAKKYAGLIGKDLWDTFQVKDGLIVLNDLNGYLDEYYNNLQNQNQELIEQTQNAIAELDVLNNSEMENTIKILKSAGKTDSIVNLLSGIGLSGAALDEATNYIINTTDLTIEGLIALLEGIGQGARNAQEYTKSGVIQAKGKAFLSGLENTVTDADKALDFMTINGFDAQDMKDQFDYDITSVSNSIALLPSAYESLISAMEMDAAERAQAISDYRNTLSSSATNLLQGTGSWQEAARLQAIAGQQDRNLQFRETAEGIQLLNSSIGDLLLSFKDDNSALYAQTYLEIAENIQTYYPELEDVFDITEKIVELEDEIKDANEDKKESLDEQVRLLKQAERYASNTANAMSFDFMSTSLSGNRENALSYFDARDTAKDAITGLYSDKTIDTGNFMRIFQFLESMGKTPAGWDWTDIDLIASTSEDGVVKLETILTQLGMSSGEFFNTLLGNLDAADEEFIKQQAKIQDDTKKSSQYLDSYYKEGIKQENLSDFKGEIRINGEQINLEKATDDQIAIIQEYLKNSTKAERDAWAESGLIDIQQNEIPSDVKTIATTLENIAADVKKIAGPEESTNKEVPAGEEEYNFREPNLSGEKLWTYLKGPNALRDQAALNKATEEATAIIEQEEKERQARQKAAAKEQAFLSNSSLSNPIEAEMAIAKREMVAYQEKIKEKSANWELQQKQALSQKVNNLVTDGLLVEGEEDLSESAKQTIREYQALINAETIYIPANTDLTEAQETLKAWQDSHPTLEVRVSLNADGSIYGTVLRSSETGGLSVKSLPGAHRVNYTGNVNGLALVNGNTISKLIAGASMANKTLVGELGPELAVYNGQYHLLGQNGAEFVNLPSDAIVFNHKQTKGIAKGQMGVRGTAMATGSPDIWKYTGYFSDIYNSIKGGSGGKGGSKAYDFVNEEGEEWYNYLRKIARLEKELNILEAERENIADGGAYLRSLREAQAIYQEQLIVQQQLVEYQKEQLALEKKNIEEKWKGIFAFNKDNTLQYTNGNETNGGKGVLDIIQALNNMSGAEQVAFVNALGYSHTDQNGKVLEGNELVSKFLEELVGDYEHFNELQDSIDDSSAALEEFKASIKEVEEEIRDNRIELEEKIYDLVVEGWENNIEKMEEELDILSEANDRYINGLSEALEKEKSLYDKNEATADREQLQRRLSLLRRSGGSASEIASLEEQLNDTLKDEYFQHQQEAIDKVAEASQTQIEKMEEQIQIQKDQLEFSKEHGLIWENVNRILSGSTSEILEFIQGNDTSFITKSITEQGKMLEDWALKVGIYSEDRAYQNFHAEAMKAYNGDYKDLYATTYANSKLKGMSSEEAAAAAVEAVKAEQNKAATGSENTGSTTITESQERTYWKFTEPGGRVRYGWRSEAAAKAEMDRVAASFNNGTSLAGSKRMTQVERQKQIQAMYASLKSYTKPYSAGGLVDYTGLAMVHGSKSRPESFLNAEQTAQITEALRSNGKNSVLSDVRQAVSEIAAAAKALVMNETNNSSSINVAPGAVVVKVEKLNDKYDIDSVADDIMNKMVSIASKATSRGVNRR